MLRILLIILVIAIVMAMLIKLRSGGKVVRGQGEKSITATLVQCTYCQLHLIQEDALESGGHYYCGAEHQKMAEIGSRRSV